MTLPADYQERVYAGVLGKLIGVYLGRPIEGWTSERIKRELGDIRYYVNERLDPAKYDTKLLVTDDDISGTFVFPRALADFGYPPRLSAAQIGKTWLNYIVEGRSILWWGGVGISTEHTAYRRLKEGIPAPRSGSAELNGQVIAEQIGGQIFIDGWALVSPGNPEQAAYLAEQAARVSHDGVAVHAARLIAAMEAQAFIEADIDRLLDTGLAFIPPDSPLRPMIGQIREWHAADKEDDWRSTRGRIAAHYGYDRYGGTCHVVPNHALIILALLYGRGSFQEALSIVCGSGWDTDCNAGNLGCLLGIRGGLAAIEAGPDWRGPVADRMYLPSAEGGGVVTDAVIEAQALVRAGYALAGLPPPPAAKQGARFNFGFPGSVQGFAPGPAEPGRIAAPSLANVPGHSRDGSRSLAIRVQSVAPGCVARAATATFFSPAELETRGYRLMGCPTLYSGQVVEMRAEADAANTGSMTLRPYCTYFGAEDRVERLVGSAASIEPSAEAIVAWRVPDTGGRPIYQIGIELGTTAKHKVDGCIYLDYVRWRGAPDTILRRPDQPGRMWRHAWVDATSEFNDRWQALRISQDCGPGMVIHGTREWQDYEVAAKLTPHLARSWGLAARVGGLRRYYAIVFDETAGQGGPHGDRVSILRVRDEITALASCAFHWSAEQSYSLRLIVEGASIRAWVDDHRLFEVQDTIDGFSGGGIALLCEDGSLSTEAVAIRPV
jgi:ADP-ribosylglycohydrolase